MSLRPREDFAGRMVRAQSRMAPGGRRWSESPIPRVPRRRVRQLGAPMNACGLVFPRTSLGPLSAHFAVADPEGYPVAATMLTIDWVSEHAGDIGWRVLSLDPYPGDPPDTAGWLPSPWYTITGPGSGVAGSDYVAEAWVGRFIGWTIEWDVAGALTSVCSTPISGG